MASLESLRTREYAKRGAVVQKQDDGPIIIRMRYVGTGAVTSVTVVTGTSIATITTGTGEGTKTYAFATYTTVGALAAAINADGIFEAKVLDALLADATTGGNFQVNGAIAAGTDENGVVCYDMLADTSVTKAITATLSLARNFNTCKLTQGHVVEAKELSYNVNISGAEVGAVRVYSRKGGVESLVYSTTSVDATVTTIDWASGVGSITSVDGGELVFRVLDGTSVTDAAANYVRIVGFLK
jgi:hypothetical protein